MGDNYPVDATEVRKRGVQGVISTGAGIGLMLVNSLLHLPVIGWILSGGLVILGIMGLVGKEKNDKVTGTALMVAGGLGLASIILPGLASFLLGVGGLGLVGFGIYSLVKFAQGMKSRS